MKRTNFHGFIGKALSIGLFAFVLLVAGCDNGGGGDNTPTEEPGADVTAKVINEAANKAGLFSMCQV